MRAAANTLPGLMGWPRNLTVPLVAAVRPTDMPVSVLLPDPLAPIIATHSPGATDSDTSSTARLAPKSTVT